MRTLVNAVPLSKNNPTHLQIISNKIVTFLAQKANIKLCANQTKSNLFPHVKEHLPSLKYMNSLVRLPRPND